jgi:hypothetical protein
MPKDWLSIRVELEGGRGLILDPPPGRVMVAGPRHTFEQMAVAIDRAFARWDLSHLHEFRLPDGRRVGFPDGEDPAVIDHSQLSVGAALNEEDVFEYVFDFGDDWRHRCAVVSAKTDPREEAGVVPRAPLPIWGWGWIPDQYGREREDE